MPFMQIPNPVTLSSKVIHGAVLPVEVGGWWMAKVGVKVGEWAMVLSSDPSMALGVHLSMRHNSGANVLCGHMKLDNNEVCNWVGQWACWCIQGR